MTKSVLTAVLVSIVGSCRSEPAQQPAEEVLYSQTCGAFELRFHGHKPPPEFPLSFGVSRLSFVDKSGESRTWDQAGELFFSDWENLVCAPDGQHLALLQDHYGPIHIVRLADLWDYLGGQPPTHTVSGVTGDIAHVHSELRWLNASTLVYQIGGSPPLTRRFVLD